MSLLDRFRLWREGRRIAREYRQERRCDEGRHHWKSLTPDRVRCCDPGCGEWYGSRS